MSQETFDFDSITVISTGKPPKVLNQSKLAFDKKSIYAGDNGNWKLKFVDLVTVTKHTMESDDYSSASRGGRCRSYGSRGANAISRGGPMGVGPTTSSQIIFHLKGAANAISLQCTIQSTRRLTAWRASSLENFINNLKKAHRKVLLKMGATDPYGEESCSSKKATVLSSNIRGKPAKANSRLITPASHNLYLSPTRNKPSRGENVGLHSPSLEKRRNGALNPQRSENDGFFDNLKARVQGNVVQQPGTPNANKKLELTAKSPLNATPLKQRLINSGNLGTYSDDDDDDGFFVQKIRRRDQNSGSSLSGGGRHRKLKSRINQKLMNFEDSEEENAESKKVKRQLESVNEGDVQDEGESGDDRDEEILSAESNKEEYVGVPKKKRLAKVRCIDNVSGENDDIDVDFETDANIKSCRKKLRLSFENEDGDEDDEEGVKHKSPTPTNTDDSPKDLLSHSSKSVTDDENSGGSPASNTAASEAFSSKERVSEQEDLKDSNATKVEKTTKPINSFFAPRSAKKTQDLKRSPPINLTYGATLSSPRKNTLSSKGSTPLSPIHPATNSSNVKITPVSKQVQKKSSYFFQINKEIGIKTESSESPRSDEAEYASDGSLGDLNSNYYEENGDGVFCSNDENSNRNANMAKKITTRGLQQQDQSKNPYGRRNVRNRFNVLGRSRLASRAPIHSLVSSAQRLDFGEDVDSNNLSASNFFASKRGSHFKPIRSTSEEDLELDKSGDSGAVVDDDPKDEDDANATVPGIRNLGNTCYLSASLQTLFSIPHFIKNLYLEYENHIGTKELPLTKALLEVAKAVGVLSDDAIFIETSDTMETKLLASTAANPTVLKKQMDVLTSKFAGFFQRDAHEFLSDLVDFLHDELTAESNEFASNVGGGDSKPAASVTEDRIVIDTAKDISNRVRGGGTAMVEKIDEVIKEPCAKLTMKKAPLPTDDFFHLNVRVCLECDSCGYSRSKDEMYRHLSIEVGNDTENDVWTVEQGLKQFFHSEKRDLKCEKCNDGKTATQTMEIISW
ncbi:hypothetical protein ACHAXS_013788 [Conticribra weissflogii]